MGKLTAVYKTFKREIGRGLMLVLCFAMLTTPVLAASASVLQPTSPGIVCFSQGGVTLDASNTADGYVSVKYDGGGKAKVKMLFGAKTYTYDLRADGAYEVFPLTGGDGTYQIDVYYRVRGDLYALGLTQKVSVHLRDPMLPFLYPNQQVNFSKDSQAAFKAAELSQTAQNKLDAVANVYHFIIGNVTYDTAKAQMASAGKLAGYIPNVDSVLASQKGICYDYAALMTAMLRSQGIPTRMEVGYVSGGVYHAWISTYITDVGWINGVIRFDGVNWTLMDPTFAASYGANAQYTGEGVNYQALYRY